MKATALSIRNGSGELLERAIAHFDEKEIETLQNYVDKIRRLSSAALLKRGMPTISKIKFTQEAGHSFTCEEYTDSELFELLHLLRPIILSKEPTSFEKAAGLIGKNFSSPHVRGFIKRLRNDFDHGELSAYMQIQIDGIDLLNDATLKLWLNGVEYHQDAEKAEQWRRLSKALENNDMRAYVIGHLHSKVKSAFKLGNIAEMLIKNIGSANI